MGTKANFIVTKLLEDKTQEEEGIDVMNIVEKIFIYLHSTLKELAVKVRYINRLEIPGAQEIM